MKLLYPSKKSRLFLTVIFLVGLASSYSKAHYHHPEFAVTKTKNKILFLSCVKYFNRSCNEYQFFLKEKKEGAKATLISARITMTELQKLRSYSSNIKEVIKTHHKNPRKEILMPTTLVAVGENLHPILIPIMAILTVPVDAILFPFTSIGYGFKVLHKEVERYRIRKAFQRMIGMRHKTVTYLNKECFKVLIKIIKGNDKNSNPLPSSFPQN